MQDVNNAIYEMAKNVYDGLLSVSEASARLKNKYNVNTNSFAHWCIPTYKGMISGTIVCGSIKISLREVFLLRILEDKGVDGLGLALDSFRKTIEYYETRGSNRPGDRKLYDKYYHLYNNRCKEKRITPNDFGLDESDSADIEGLRKQVYVNIYERSALARKKAIEYHGVKCMVCGFELEKRYGVLGRNFIHIHHIVPISGIGKEYIVNYKTDLVPVCPNCHAMLHKGNLTIDELKKIVKHYRR